MKNLLVLLTLLLSFSLYAPELKEPTYNYHKNLSKYDVKLINYSGWKQSKQVIHYNEAAFYYAIFRSEHPINNQGQYKYEVWFASASYLYDYYKQQPQLQKTYIYGIYLVIDNQTLYTEPRDIIVKEPRRLSSLTFYSTNPYIMYQISWHDSQII